MTQSAETLRKDFSVSGSWGSALVLAALAVTVAAGLLLRHGWTRPSVGTMVLAIVVGEVVLIGAVSAVANHPWKVWSVLSMAVALGVVATLGYLLATSRGASSVTWLVVASLLVLIGVAHFFSRPVLLVVMLGLLLLVLGETIRVGQQVTDAERLVKARTELTQLMAERCAATGEDPTLAAADGWIRRAWPDPDPKTAPTCALFGKPGEVASTPPTEAGGLFEPNATSTRGLAANVARAELAMAEAHLALADPDTATATAEVESAHAALDEAVAQSGLVPSPSSVFDLLSTGAGRVVQSLPVFGHVDVPIELTAAGWLVLAGVGLIIFRLLSIYASRGGLGPVRIDADDSKKAELGVYLARNIPEPGTVPGSEAISTVTDLLAAESGPAATWIDRIGRAISNAFNVPAGYDVKFAVVGGDRAGQADAAADAEWLSVKHGVSALVSDTRTRRQLALRTFFGSSDENPWRTAAYWAAAVVQERCIEVPPWATWRTSASPALSVYYANEDMGSDERQEQLNKALRDAPDNALLLMHAAGKYDLGGKTIDSFLLALRAATSHPNYLLGRYRLAIQASSMAVDTESWDTVDERVRQEICQLLSEPAGRGSVPSESAAAAEALHKVWSCPPDEPLDEDAKVSAQRALVKMGRDRAESLHHDLAVVRLIPGLLRRTERKATFAMFQSSDLGLSLRKRLRDLASSVVVMASVRERRFVGAGQQPAEASPGDKKNEGKLVARAEKRESGWQLAYNVACLFAVRAELPDEQERSDACVDRAFEFLSRALERPGSAKLVRGWVEKDPDLKSLRGDPRYQELLQALGSEVPTGSQRHELMTQALPTLTRWVDARLKSARQDAGLGGVITVRSASRLAEGLLRDAASHADRVLPALLGDIHATTYNSSPEFSRIRCTLPIAGGEPEIDVLHQIAWGSERHQRRVERWVDSVVAVENGFAWHGLRLHADPLALTAEVSVDERRWAEILRVAAPHVVQRPLDRATLAECRSALDAPAGQRLWVIVSGPAPALDAAATSALGGGVVSSVPESLVPAGIVVVTALEVLDAVLHRGTDLSLSWDESADGIDLVLEQLVAVEVLRRPRAVFFALA